MSEVFFTDVEMISYSSMRLLAVVVDWYSNTFNWWYLL